MQLLDLQVFLILYLDDFVEDVLEGDCDDSFLDGEGDYAVFHFAC